MNIRQAEMADIGEIMRIYDIARQTMRERGNNSQWVDGYPSTEVVAADIAACNSYVIEEDGIIHAAFMFEAGVDPTYVHIDGAWPDDAPYGVIHRVGFDGVLRGVMHAITAFASARIDHLRADTHEDNHTMRAALLKEGFVYCGVIHRAEDGATRLAYALTVPAENGHR